MRGRRITAGVLAAIGLLLMPGAIVANWATTQVVDTERFVAVLAPLADNPVVQDRIIAEVTGLVDEQIDLDAVTTDLLSGIGEALGLGPRAQDALGLVSAPIAAGVRSFVADIVTEVVRSDAFSAVWERSLTELHTQTIALLSGSPDAVLNLDRDGTLSLPLGPIVAEVRATLIEQGVPFAGAIPDTERAIVLAEVPDLALARGLFQLGTAIGAWLPWITVALLGAAVLTAPRRPRTSLVIGLTALGVTAALALGVALARTMISAAVGTESAAVALPVYDALTSGLVVVLVVLAAVSALIALGGWWFGTSGLAVRARAVVSRGVRGHDALPATTAD